MFEEGKRALSKQMPDCFQLEIDRVAMREGLAGSDEYLDQWEWTEKREREGDAKAILSEIFRELEENHEIISCKRSNVETRRS